VAGIVSEARARVGSNLARETDLRMHRVFRPHSIVVPDDDYLEKVQALCRKHNVLLICDEVQTVRGFPPLFLPFLYVYPHR
jgi:hypothetical protein